MKKLKQRKLFFTVLAPVLLINTVSVNAESEQEFKYFNRDVFDEMISKEDLTLIELWGPWCIWCARSLPGVSQSVAEFRENGGNIQVLTIISQRDSLPPTRENINEFFGSDNFDNLSVLENREATDYLLEIYPEWNGKYPLHLLIDKEKNIIEDVSQEEKDEITKNYLAKTDMTEEEFNQSEIIQLWYPIYKRRFDKRLEKAKLVTPEESSSSASKSAKIKIGAGTAVLAACVLFVVFKKNESKKDA